MEINLTDKNIILIGMPGSGKSTIGPLVAKTMGYGFIDSDIVIQMENKCLLADIIEIEGAEGFLKIENRINASMFAQRCIISTGGSVVYCEEAMEHLKSIGTVIYLDLPYEEIEKRLGNIIISRGVVIKNGETLFDLYNERLPLYQKYADHTVKAYGQTIEQTVHAVCEIIASFGKDR